MDRSDYLYARPSFFRGMAKVLDIVGNSEIYNDSNSAVEADLLALQSDWCMVGNDLKGALDEYYEETKK